MELTRSHELPRLVFILAAGSLRTGDNHHLLIEDLRRMPDADAWVSIPENQLLELEYLRCVTDVDWEGASPSAQFEPGEARGMVLGIHELLVASDETSHTTMGTMAVAILDEIEHPTPNAGSGAPSVTGDRSHRDNPTPRSPEEIVFRSGFQKPGPWDLK